MKNFKAKILEWFLPPAGDSMTSTPEPMTTAEAPLEIKIEDYNDVPVFKAKPAEIKAWVHWLQCYRRWCPFYRWLKEFNWENYGEVQDYQFLHAIGYDKAQHRAIFALDAETYYAIDFDEEDKAPTNQTAAHCVLVRLRLIGEKFYQLNRRPIRVEIVKPTPNRAGILSPEPNEACSDANFLNEN